MPDNRADWSCNSGLRWWCESSDRTKDEIERVICLLLMVGSGLGVLRDDWLFVEASMARLIRLLSAPIIEGSGYVNSNRWLDWVQWHRVVGRQYVKRRKTAEERFDRVTDFNMRKAAVQEPGMRGRAQLLYLLNARQKPNLKWYTSASKKCDNAAQGVKRQPRRFGARHLPFTSTSAKSRL